MHSTYSSKAEKYARYRWDYAPQAVETIFTLAKLNPQSLTADIGAGTGILTRHFAGQVGRVYAIEPNTEMRREAARRLPLGADCVLLGGDAERIPLPDHCLDLITVAQAIHWFDPEPTRQEFARVLRPGGWLALLRNYGTDEAVGKALAEISTPENGVSESKGAPAAFQRPPRFYFGSSYRLMTFAFTGSQDWEAFIGSICSASYMPDESHPAFPRFEAAAREVFERFSQNGEVTSHGETELIIGRVIQL
jgi:ubiquinone/menaquinone biosynthesis C-methylase UbiE